MWQQIQSNKKNTILLIFGLFLLLNMVGASIICCGVAFEGGTSLQDMQRAAFTGSVMATIMWVCLLVYTLLFGRRTLLSKMETFDVKYGTHLVLENIVQEMTIASGLIKTPEIKIINTPMPNAFAVGFSPKDSAIVVTTGLLTRLNRDELQGVIAHEIAHIVNRDTMYMLFASVMIGTIVCMCESALKGQSRSRSSSRSSSGKGSSGAAIVFLVLMILAPIVAKLFYFAISKKREYLADACAAQFTRYPQGLASALLKISSYQYDPAEFPLDNIKASMFIINPLKKLSGWKEFFNGLFSTHPPTDKRIDVLMRMTGADYKSYNEAFSKISEKNTPILNEEFLKDVKHVDIRQAFVENAAAMPLSAVATGSAVGAKTATLEETQKKEELVKKREAEDIIWHAQNYIFKQCECGTKLKFPLYYEGKTITCPHCKRAVQVSK